METKFDGRNRRWLATGIPERRPAPFHYVVAKDGDKELEVLRMLLRENSEVLPVFSAGWAASGYLFAEAPGGGWYVKPCSPDELVLLLVGPCSGVEWVALDPRPGPRPGGEAATVMPRESFVDYLLGLVRPLWLQRNDSETTDGESHGRESDL